jgi:hypothetical protein
MTSWRCAAAGLAAIFSLAGANASAAQGADPVFGAFHDACLATGAEPAAVTAATAGHGWKPSEASGTPIAGFAVTDKVSRTAKVGESELKLFDWHGAKGAISADECQVGVSKTDYAALISATATSLGFVAQQTTPEKSVFQFAGPVDAPKPIDKTGFDAAAGAGGLMLLTISKQGAGAFVELLRIRK